MRVKWISPPIISGSILLVIFGCNPPAGSGSDREKELEEKYDLLQVMIPTERAVRAALQDPDPSLKGRGALVATRHGYRSLLPLIRANVKDDHWFVRYHSLSALQIFRDERSLPVFLEALEDEDSSVRFKALMGLADQGDYSIYPYLLKKLEDENTYVRAAAAYALGKLKLVEAVPALIEKLSSQNRSLVRRETYLALQNITGLNFPPKPGPWQAWWRENKDDSAR